MRVLAIGDIHEPCSKRGYRDFCQEIYDLWDCDSVVIMGDIVDWHALSFYVKNPNMPSAEKAFTCDESEEIKRAQNTLYALKGKGMGLCHHVLQDVGNDRDSSSSGSPEQFGYILTGSFKSIDPFGNTDGTVAAE